METADQNTNMCCLSVILISFCISALYVSSLYIWRNPYDRDHPTTIKKRFLSVFIVCLISPTILYFGLNEKYLEKASFLELLGLRWSGLIQAIVMPLLLTMTLYFGPLCIEDFSGFKKIFAQSVYKLENLKTLGWWRGYIVAPLTEEWTFRACMLPLLLQCFAPITAIFVCALFFGIAHFHHILTSLKGGAALKSALCISCSHVAYTTAFGVYAAFLFIQTGHFVAPLTAHSLCNILELPDFRTAFNGSLRKFTLFFTGLVFFFVLLKPMTDPRLFGNDLFWHMQFV